MSDLYRIRWAKVWVLSNRDHYDIMCMAERRVKFLWIFKTWWPVGEWHHSEGQSEADIEEDQRLRQKLPEPRFIPEGFRRFKPTPGQEWAAGGKDRYVP